MPPVDPPAGAVEPANPSADAPAAAAPSPFKDRTVFRVGVVVGLLLVATALALNAIGLVWLSFQTVVLAVGLGIVLGAFGSLATANVPLAGATVSGAAAIALVIVSVINTTGQSGFLKIRVTGDVKGADLKLRGDQFYHGHRFSALDQEFVIFGNDIGVATLRLEYVPADPQKETIFFACIMKDTLRSKLGTGETLEWTLHTDEPRLINTLSGDLVSRAFTLDCAPSRESDRPLAIAASPAWDFSPIGTAHAQPQQMSVEQLVEGFALPSPALRGGYREDLTKAGGSAVSPLLQSLKEPEALPDNAVVDAFTTVHDIATQGAASGEDVLGTLSTDDRKVLVDGIGAEQRAVRFLAADLLVMAGGVDTVVSIVEGLPRLDSTGRQNALAVGSRAADALSPQAAAAARARIDTLLRSGTLDSESTAIARRIQSALGS